MATQDLNNRITPDIAPHATPDEGYSVLLAEDDPALRRYLQIVLLRAGYNVFAASDGLEAMKLLLSHSFDVVVTDAVMPNLSGHELCRFVRSTERLSHLPLVLLSALDPKNAEVEQADVFLTKPISPERLLECLERLVSDKLLACRSSLKSKMKLRRIRQAEACRTFAKQQRRLNC